jgi:hypothetical protein
MDEGLLKLETGIEDKMSEWDSARGRKIKIHTLSSGAGISQAGS